MPPRDYVALVSSLRDGDPISHTVRPNPQSFAVGDVEQFWISDLDASRTYQITATLRLQSDHGQMWVQSDADIEQDALARSAQSFEEHIYPTNRKLFGSEWTPGIDGDPHLVVLNASFSGAAGYFSSANEYTQEINPYSNEREMFVMNLNALQPGASSYDAVLAHEFQHMIHWRQDSNEDAWLNEGLSELAEQLNGFSWPAVAVKGFAADPDLQLDTWSDDARMGDHYGASYLLARYVYERYGAESILALTQESANGVLGLDRVLAQQQPASSFEALWADWIVANALDRPDLGNGYYGYAECDVSAASQQVMTYPYTILGDVHQYAADYWELLPSPDALSTTASLQITFIGDREVALTPNEPTSGQYQWWSNRGDSSHSYLERSFDLRGITTATLSYNLWYDIEAGWDYAYVRASTDGGQNWKLLVGKYTTDYNPNGNALGPGYTGKSGVTVQGAASQEPQWVREELDLKAYCGHEILLRLDYVTDDAVNGKGLCLDDFELTAIGYQDDVESDDGDWQAAGFVRHNNRLPQRYVVQVVEFAPEPRVRRLPIGANGRGELEIKGLGQEVQRALLIISAVTPVTTESANYRVQFIQD